MIHEDNQDYSQEQIAKDLEKDMRDRMLLDEKADFHSRISTLESAIVRTNRRITRLEDGGRGSYSDDPLSQIFSPGMVWLMILLTLAPLAVELIKQWRSES